MLTLTDLYIFHNELRIPEIPVQLPFLSAGYNLLHMHKTPNQIFVKRLSCCFLAPHYPFLWRHDSRLLLLSLLLFLLLLLLKQNGNILATSLERFQHTCYSRQILNVWKGSASLRKCFLNTVDSFPSLAMQSHAFLLHQKTRLQHCSRNRCELATTQFGCRCLYHAVSEQT